MTRAELVNGVPDGRRDAAEASRHGRTMPSDFAIAVRPGSGTDTARAERVRGERPAGARRQPMRGFEDTYTDIVDYIVRITDRIWERQDVGYIYDTYAPGCMVHDDSGPHHGVERVVEATVAAIHAFPDTRSYADDVIWAGDDDAGFHTSHRYVTVGHHLGAWRWGRPTGRRVELWGIADCVVRENEIHEEWVLYNMTSRLMQLGVDIAQAARAYGNEVRLHAEVPVGEVPRLTGGRHPEYFPAQDGTSFDVEHAVRALWHDLYNRRDLSAVDRAYSPTVRWRSASDRSGAGRQVVRAMARALLATFPDLGMQVEDVYWMGNPADGYRVSLRWSAQGTHRGHALYGAPTGRRVQLWGIDQLYVTPDPSGAGADGRPDPRAPWPGYRITADWMMWNEFDVLAQLLADEPRPALG